MDYKEVDRYTDRFYLLGYKHATEEAEIGIDHVKVRVKNLRENYKRKYKEEF